METSLNPVKRPKRIGYIDVAKFIGVLLVIYAHSLPGDNYACLALYSFHLPIFFILNGMTLKFREGESFPAFFWKKVKNLVIPMFLLGMMIGIEKIIVNRTSGLGVPDHYLLQVFVSLWEQKRQFPLWFLGALMISDCLFYLCHYLGRDKLSLTGIFAFIIFLVGVYCNKYYKVVYGWNLDTGLIAVIFVYVGYAFSHQNLSKIRKVLLYNRLISFLFGIGLLCFGLGIAYLNHKYFNSNLEMFACRYTKFYLTIPAAILSSFGTICISYTIANPVLAHLGQTTLVVYSMHQEFAFPYFRKWFADFYTATTQTAANDPQRYLYGLYQTLFALAFLLPLYYVIAYSPLAMAVNRKQPGYMRWIYRKVSQFFTFRYYRFMDRHYLNVLFEEETYVMKTNKKQSRYLILDKENKIQDIIKVKVRKDKAKATFVKLTKDDKVLSSVLSRLDFLYIDKELELNLKNDSSLHSVALPPEMTEIIQWDKTTGRNEYSYLTREMVEENSEKDAKPN